MTGKRIKTLVVAMMMMVVIFVPINSAFAKEPQFRLDIDSLNQQVGVSADLVFSMIDAKGAEIKEIQGIDDFEVLTTMQSTSTQTINGDTTRETSTTYTIMPKQAGDYTLKGVVEYKGKTYETNELQLHVTEISQADEGDQAVTDDLFIKTELSKDQLFLGEKVVLSYTLYSRYNIESYGFTEAINIDGLMLEEVPEDQLTNEIVYLNGEKYAKYEAKQLILSPLKTGTFTIPSCNFQANVSTNGGFFSSSKAMYLKTEEKEVTIKSLPKANQPSDFSGVVGELTIEANYSQQEMDVDDSLSLKVVASGDCNLDNLNQIMGEEIDGFSVYETQKEVEEYIENNQYRAKKEFELILVPEKTGKIEIDSIMITYFDPDAQRYKSAKINGTTINVTGNLPQVETQETSEDKGIVSPESMTISQVSYQTQALKDEAYITIKLRKDWMIFILCALFIGIGIGGTGLYLRKQQQGDKSLKALYRQLSKANNKNELYNLFNQMIKEQFDVSLKAKSKQEIKNKLSEYEIDDAVLAMMDSFEQETMADITEIKDKIKAVYKKMIKIDNKKIS